LIASSEARLPAAKMSTARGTRGVASSPRLASLTLPPPPRQTKWKMRNVLPTRDILGGQKYCRQKAMNDVVAGRREEPTLPGFF